MIGQYSGPLFIPLSPDERAGGWGSNHTSAFGRRYAGFCDLIHSSRDKLKAKRRTKGWVIKMIQDVLDSKKCRKVIEPSIASPKGFDPIAWSTVYKISLHLNTQYSSLMSLFNQIDRNKSGEIDGHEFESLSLES